jgi:hypothetical protein
MAPNVSQSDGFRACAFVVGCLCKALPSRRLDIVTSVNGFADYDVSYDRANLGRGRAALDTPPPPADDPGASSRSRSTAR